MVLYSFKIHIHFLRPFDCINDCTVLIAVHFDFPENVPDMKFCHSLYCKTQADFNFTILIAMDPKYKIAVLLELMIINICI